MAEDDAQQTMFHLLDVLSVDAGATRAGVERVEALATETRAALEAIATEARAGFDRVERRLGRVETRIEGIEGAFRSTDQRVSALEARP